MASISLRRPASALRAARGLMPLLAVLAPALLAATPAHAGPFFSGIGHLAGGTHSQALGVSADGSVVVGLGRTSLGDQAARWTQVSGLQPITDGSGSPVPGSAVAVSADGSIATGPLEELLRLRFYVKQQAGAFTIVGNPTDETSMWITPHAISEDGSQVLGTMQTATGQEAFAWTEGGGVVGYGQLAGGSDSEFRDLSADGLTFVGGARDSGGNALAIRWTAGGGMQSLGSLAGYTATATATGVSDDGAVIVGGVGNGTSTTAFVWTETEGLVALPGTPEGFSNTWASGVSGSGEAIVGTGVRTVGTEAWYWTSALGMRNVKDYLTAEIGLDLTGWSLTSATGISADGRTLIGIGLNPDGQVEGWVAYLGSDLSGGFAVPEPSTWALGLTGLVVLSAWRVRTHRRSTA